MKNKKAASELGWNKIIILILVLCVVIFIIYAVVKLNTNETFKNLFPTFFAKEVKQTPGEMSSQPVELRTEDPCIEYDFYWADINGAMLETSPKEIKEGTVYIAIKFKEGIGDLNDAKNTQFAKCADYEVAIYLTKKSLVTPVDQFPFKYIQDDYPKVRVQGKEYYLLPFEAIDPGWGFFSWEEYRFKIKKGVNLIREGSAIRVK